MLQRRDDRWEREIDALDPERDAHRIVRILAEHVFPIDTLLVAELAQLRTFSIPSISAILHATRRYEEQGGRRLDDTRAILTEILTPGPGHPAGQEMIEHLNRIHSRYRISNDDYLYTLSSFILDIGPWLDRNGWRPLRECERQAIHNLYVELGSAMGIEQIPESWQDFAAWRVAYEARYQHHAASNEAVAGGMLAAIASLAPAPLRPLLISCTTALVHDDAVRRALGLPRPGRFVRGGVAAVLTARKHLLRHLTPWNERSFWETDLFRTFPTYPDGYDRLKLGPREAFEHLGRHRAAAVGG